MRSIRHLTVLLLILTFLFAVAGPANAASPTVTAIAGGGSSGYALKSDGTVWAWGFNGPGELGNNSTISSDVPVQVYGLTGVTAIAGGDSSDYALKPDGTVWAWGWNAYGELGNGSSTSSDVPVQVYGLTSVTAIAGGGSSGYALKSDGTVRAWGWNGFGALGDGSLWNSDVPVQVYGLSGVTAMASGSDFTTALKSEGTVWAWGANSAGTLGNKSPSFSDVPMQVSGLSGVTAIADGESTGYALKPDGTVWAWGSNYDGALGNNSTVSYSDVPVQVYDLTGVTAISGRGGSGYALKSDGTVRAWGSNYDGALGNNSTVSYSDVPVQVYDLSGITAIAGGLYNGYALKSDGTVWAWGDNYAGQLGNNSTVSYSDAPVQVSGLASRIQETALTLGGATSGAYDDPATVTATLSSPSAPVAGVSVTLTLGSQHYTATTDANGVATFDITPEQAVGTYSLEASFAGNSDYQASTATESFMINPEETSLSLTSPTAVANGGNVTVSATLLEDGSTAVAGKTVTFTLGSQTVTGETDARGQANGTFTVNQPLGPETVSASFSGDSDYLPAVASGNTVVFAYLNQCAFVIGDQTGTVNFWGAQWSKNNSLSGAPASFKGFASQVNGSTWSTTGGNSSNPPDTLPAYMAVIVSNSVSKSGSAISGNIVSMVVVKTDLGYAPNPGHAGYGTVVAAIQ